MPIHPYFQPLSGADRCIDPPDFLGRTKDGTLVCKVNNKLIVGKGDKLAWAPDQGPVPLEEGAELRPSPCRQASAGEVVLTWPVRSYLPPAEMVTNGSDPAALTIGVRSGRQMVPTSELNSWLKLHDLSLTKPLAAEPGSSASTPIKMGPLTLHGQLVIGGGKMSAVLLDDGRFALAEPSSSKQRIVLNPYTFSTEMCHIHASQMVRHFEPTDDLTPKGEPGPSMYSADGKWRVAGEVPTAFRCSEHGENELFAVTEDLSNDFMLTISLQWWKNSRFLGDQFVAALTLPEEYDKQTLCVFDLPSGKAQMLDLRLSSAVVFTSSDRMLLHDYQSHTLYVFATEVPAVGG